MSAATDAFLAMLAAERGAAANTLAAYRRDLAQAEDAVGDLAEADRDAVAGLAGVWASLAPASVARKAKDRRSVNTRCRPIRPASSSASMISTVFERSMFRLAASCDCVTSGVSQITDRAENVVIRRPSGSNTRAASAIMQLVARFMV